LNSKLRGADVFRKLSISLVVSKFPYLVELPLYYHFFGSAIPCYLVPVRAS